MKHHDIQLTGSISITGSLSIPVGTTAERPLNPKSGSIRMNTTTGVLEIYTAVSGAAWENVGEQVGAAPASIDIEYLLVAGGGGGSQDFAGGGGAGGLLSSSLASVESGSSFTITIGAGGDRAFSSAGYNGADSTIAGTTISTITAIGGGGGAGSAGGGSAGNGGSGGGAGNGNGSGGSGTAGQGFAGHTAGSSQGAGGGGAGAAATTENGAIGKASSITGTSIYYAGGGAGSTSAGTQTGGQGGGGNYGTSGTVNTGGGGGGYYGSWGLAGDGGSGVAIFAYDSGSINCAGGIIGDAGNGRKYHQFNTSGTLKVGNTTTDFVIPSSILNKAVIHVDAGNFSSRGTSTWTDLKGNANGTVGGATLGNNFYYDFDGTNDYINFGDNSATSRTGAFGFDLWIKIDSGHTGTSPVHKETQYSIDIDSNMNIRYADSSTWSYATFGSTASGVSTDTWFHWAVTKDSSNIVTMWINGSSVVSKSFGSAITDTANNLYLGTYDNSSSWTNGKIAQFRLYSNSLSTAEVLQIYNATKHNFV